MGSLPTPAIKRIAIIGGGPAGVATAKYLLAENCFSQIDIYEQQATVGGAWNYTEVPPQASIPVPQTDPHQPLEVPTWAKTPSGLATPIFTSPMYSHLETNIPKPLMAFSDTPFPASEQLFPPRAAVTSYLDAYAAPIKPLIRFSTQVSAIRSSASTPTTWTLTATDLLTSRTTTSPYDAIAVCSGHYTVPYIPPAPGLTAWARAYPATITHSKHYRHPSAFAGKKVLVVGNAASGTDIAAHLLPHAALPLLLSSRSESPLAPPPAGVLSLPEIAAYLPPSPHLPRAVRFANGHVESHLDAVLYCTGYLYSFPFLPRDTPPLTTGHRVPALYQHLFSIAHPSLAFLLLPTRVLPFPLAEAQAAVVARVWAGRLPLPDRDAMRAWEAGVLAAKGDGRGFHAMPFPEDVEYHNGLVGWAKGAGEGGKAPRGWGKGERWLRERFPAVKRAFAERGEGRGEVRGVEELGFGYERWGEEEGGKGVGG
ncbi:hypothetical protein MMC13_004495 [Lambiella insularis]|nr:hypothetical protein [Lambiella insularis]